MKLFIPLSTWESWSQNRKNGRRWRAKASGPQTFPSLCLKLNTLHTLEVLPSKDHVLLTEGHQSLIHLYMLETRKTYMILIQERIVNVGQWIWWRGFSLKQGRMENRDWWKWSDRTGQGLNSLAVLGGFFWQWCCCCKACVLHHSSWHCLHCRHFT